MTQAGESKQILLLAATGPLFACATSVFTAVVIVAVSLVCTLCASALVKLITQPQREKSADSNLCLVIAAGVSAIIVSALLLTLVTLGFSDIVAAFAPQMTLAAFAATLLGSGEKAVPTTIRSSALIIAVSVVCELIGRGTLLGDYELAFAGATYHWLLRTGLPPISFLATPAGALLVAALIFALPLRSRHAVRNDAPAISEPRNGRRVRVTGHIS